MHPVNPSGSITTRPRYQPRTSSRLTSTRDDADAAVLKRGPNYRAAAGPVVSPASRISTTTTTTRRPRPLPPTSTPPPSSKLPTGASARTPLRSRDRNQNVLSLTATRSTIKSSIYSMPPPSDRPRQPQLSAAAARAAANRTPLTPKVAAPKGPPVVTPLVRRTQNHQTPTYAAAQSNHRDEAVTTTPTASYLSHNITPRSGPRQSRVDSANSTPNGTPNPERTNDPWEDGRSSTGSGMGGYPISALNYDGGRQTLSGESSVDSNESKFFYASDAKTSQLATQRPTSVPQKPATFFYANGTSTANANRRTSPPMNPALSPPIIASTPDTTSTSKFFYANGTPDVSSKPTLPVSSSGSTVSSSSRVLPKRPSTSQSTTGTMGLNPSIPPRPLSPVKAMSTPTLQTQKNNAVPASQPLRTTQLASPPMLPTMPSPTQKRQVTIDTSQKAFRGHARAGSIPTTEPMRLTIASNSPEPCSPPLSPGISPGPSQPAMTMASILQAAEELDDDSDAKEDESPAELQSPTKSNYSNDAISELVANARRERKVQDLEITNASLEAINRTLERQLRKQTAELRRYRRLSRSGRISLASVPSSRVASDAFTEPPTDLSDVDEDEDDTEEEDFDSLDDSDLSDTSVDPLSPSARMTARRKRDEKRLQLDLTKHQELLVDSQKMNQSLKRCLNWTEVLIKEGHRALAYRVRVSDVELGGHVLAPPDEEDEVASHHGDGTSQGLDLGLEPPWTKGPQDRDSGIELPVEGG